MLLNLIVIYIHAMKYVLIELIMIKKRRIIIIYRYVQQLRNNLHKHIQF